MTETTIETAMGHLGTALVQQSPKDDVIIMDHVRKSYDLLAGLARIQRQAGRPVFWEDVSHLLCSCGTDHCDANNHAPDHDMSAERYVEQYGCGTTEVFKTAERVAKFINDRESAEVAALRREATRHAEVIGWIDAWISNPVGAYSVAALDGLFKMTRDRIEALNRPLPQDDAT